MSNIAAEVSTTNVARGVAICVVALGFSSFFQKGDIVVVIVVIPLCFFARYCGG